MANGGHDPTKNVLDLAATSNLRQDDLREAERRFFESEISHVKELAALRELHQQRLDAAESARIDSIRQVDVLATATTAGQALTAIQALAQTQLTSAETLRGAVATTAATLAKQLEGTVAEFNKRLSTLEQSSYEGMGKQKMSDPQMEQMKEIVAGLVQSQAAGTGKTEGISSAWGILLGAAALIGLVVSIAQFMSNKPATPVVAPAPQVIYVPSTPPAK
jgi:hypothetical protein